VEERESEEEEDAKTPPALLSILSISEQGATSARVIWGGLEDGTGFGRACSLPAV
jgi:hypothetical protein